MFGGCTVARSLDRAAPEPPPRGGRFSPTPRFGRCPLWRLHLCAFGMLVGDEGRLLVARLCRPAQVCAGVRRGKRSTGAVSARQSRGRVSAGPILADRAFDADDLPLEGRPGASHPARSLRIVRSPGKLSTGEFPDPAHPCSVRTPIPSPRAFIAWTAAMAPAAVVK